ncbi:MAG: leucine--tRNA ligase [Tepidisphaeraceae bacterium]|jgi:leucyl-tRNA synthetase
MAYDFASIEKKWQNHWLEQGSFRALDPDVAGGMPKAYILDMFPYPSGAGLHVGHPEGYTATDIVSRYLRMKGYNVLHPMGWDAFGLPAEQYAIKQNVHPRITTEKNIETFRRQIRMLGLGYDWDREINTTDPNYYRWTQWIFLQLFNSYFDPVDQVAKPIQKLIRELENDNYVVAPDGTVHSNPTSDPMDIIGGEVRVEQLWRDLTEGEQREVIDGQRLAYMDDQPVNWCPELGTVLANEEVIDGKSEVGGFPVVRQPMRQWMLRITAYSQRLLDDLGPLQWPESLKEMQRNWIGKSEGAEVDFELDGATLPTDAKIPEEEQVITVFTTRPDTLYGATYMVLAPEHPLVNRITSPAQRAAVTEYQQMVAAKSERDRIADTKEKSGAFTGAFAINPVNDERIPIWIADYVLMGYGTGAIMAVPAHDQRDYEFARRFELPIVVVVRPAGQPAPPDGKAFEGEGVAVNSLSLDGLPTPKAKEMMIHILHAEGVGRKSVKFKLRDWLFSRQRYWGEPFPIILDAEGNAWAVPENELPVVLPEVEDFKPTGTPEPPLSKAREWANVKLDGQPAIRETNTMPQWAGSCWYYLRYIDPENTERFVDPAKEKYWMPVDLYVGGVEHAVLHLLYSRFWHKVLFDLGHVSTPEPFQRLVNQGIILGEMEYLTVENPQRKVAESEVEKTESGYRLKSNPSIRVEAQSFKMSKARGNVVNPDDIVAEYGADCFRLYEMYMGPLEQQKPWNTRDIVGMSRFLSGVWRNLIGDEDRPAQVVVTPIPDALDRQMHRTIKKVGEDIAELRFNTAIAELIKLNNEITHLSPVPKELAENLVLMLAPFAPHIAEEIWNRFGHATSLVRHPWPKFDEKKLEDTTLELPVQVNGKLRGMIKVPADASKETVLKTAKEASSVQPWLAGKTVARELYVEKKLVNFVVNG